MSRSIRMELPSLAKEGWPRHQVNGPVPLKSADGHERSECEPDRAKQGKVVRSTSDKSEAGTNHSSLFRPIGLTFAPLMPVCAAKEASPLFLNGRSHPSFAKS